MSISKHHKIRICVPCAKNHSDVSTHCADMVNKLHTEGWDVGYSAGLYPGDNRNRAIRGEDNSIKIKNFSFDKIVFIDTDIVFTYKQLEMLISQDHPILSGVYPWMIEDRKDYAVAGICETIGLKTILIPMNTKGQITVSWVGAGFLCVTAEALRQLNNPYFRHELLYFDDKCIEIKEDLGFCLQCKKAGIPIVIDFDIRLGHSKQKQ